MNYMDQSINTPNIKQRRLAHGQCPHCGIDGAQTFDENKNLGFCVRGHCYNLTTGDPVIPHQTSLVDLKAKRDAALKAFDDNFTRYGKRNREYWQNFLTAQDAYMKVLDGDNG